jgi:ubiquinone biosynthesis protein UbiJ
VIRRDFEETLSQAVGDVLAHRLSGALDDLISWKHATDERLCATLAEYLVHESGLLVSCAELQEFDRQRLQLESDLQRLGNQLDATRPPIS